VKEIEMPKTYYDPQHGDAVIVTPRYRTGEDRQRDYVDGDPWTGVLHVGPGHRKLVADGEVVAEIRRVQFTTHKETSAEIVGLIDGCVEGRWIVEPACYAGCVKEKTMSTHPIDIIVNAMVDAKLTSQFSARIYADVAAKALTDDEIVANAVQALRNHSWTRDRRTKTCSDHDDLDRDRPDRVPLGRGRVGRRRCATQTARRSHRITAVVRRRDGNVLDGDC
jgi:hypothetical protein